MSSEASSLEHLHPLGILVLALERGRAWLGAALPLLVAAGVSLGMLAAALLLALAVGALLALGVLEWRALTFGVQHGSLVLRRGLLGRETVSVPLSRIQSVDVESTVAARVLGVRGVTVRTAAGSGTVRLAAISGPAEARLRQALGHRAAASTAGEEVVRALPASRLPLLAVTSPRIGAGAVALYALFNRLDELTPGDLSGRLVPVLAPRSAIATVAEVVLALVLVAAASVVGATLAWAGFRIVRDGPRLRLRRGLLTVRETVVPVERVRAVEMRQGLVREALRLCSLTVRTAGSGRGDPQSATLFPLLSVHESARLVRETVPALDLEGVPLRCPPRRARGRAVRRLALPAALPAGALALLLAPFGIVALLIVPAAGLVGLARWRDAGVGLSGGRLRWRRRVLAPSTTLAQARAVQWRRVRQSPLQRRRGLATLEVGLAVPPGAARVPDLAAGDAAALARALAPGRLKVA